MGRRRQWKDASRSENPTAFALNQPTRVRILEVIRDQPGIHCRGIQQHVGLCTGTLCYHLEVLEKGGLITWRRLGHRKCFFPPGHPMGVVGPCPACGRKPTGATP